MAWGGGYPTPKRPPLYVTASLAESKLSRQKTTHTGNAASRTYLLMGKPQAKPPPP